MRPVTDLVRTVAPFEVISEYVPSGDQPTAIEDLSQRVSVGERDIVLLGATGTGKSATAAWLIERLQRPTLVMAPNKTLAAQLANEFRELLPNNAIEYFVSYYDYYQPEAYVPQTDTYIEKDSSINEEVERLRHSATNSLLTRRDVVVVATVSAIYGLGTPQEYVDRMLRLGASTEMVSKFYGLTHQEVALRRDILGLPKRKGRHPVLDEAQDVALWERWKAGVVERHIALTDDMEMLALTMDLAEAMTLPMSVIWSATRNWIDQGLV